MIIAYVEGRVTYRLKEGAETLNKNGVSMSCAGCYFEMDCIAEELKAQGFNCYEHRVVLLPADQETADALTARAVKQRLMS